MPNFKINRMDCLPNMPLRVIHADEPINSKNFISSIPGIEFVKDNTRYSVFVCIAELFPVDETCKKLIKTYRK